MLLWQWRWLRDARALTGSHCWGERVHTKLMH